MASYQMTCSVTRPMEPTARHPIGQFQDKAALQVNSIFHDVALTGRDPDGGQQGQGTSGDGQEGGDNLMLCALVTKTNVSFSGTESRVKLPFYWCDLCPFDTESRVSLLQHVMSQHTFKCRHCPYTALSRCLVVRHSLQQHPQFVNQFREQKLKGCQLRVSALRSCLQPQASVASPRKRVAEVDGLEPQAPDKRSRGDDGGDGDAAAAELKRENVEEEGDVSSDSSVDELPVSFVEVSRQGDPSSEHLSPAVAAGVGSPVLALNENIVSSSGMEPDTCTDAGLALNGEVTLCRDQRQDQGRSATQASALQTDGLHQPAFATKQERDPEEEDFALALGKAPGDHGEQQASQGLPDNDSTASASHSLTSVRVKQEPLDPQTDRRDSMESASAASNALHQGEPLSSQTENTHQQAEDNGGFGRELSPVRQAQPRSKTSLLATQVDNFLLDAPASLRQTVACERRACREGASGEAVFTTSVLRHLLTRPYLQSDGTPEPSSDPPTALQTDEAAEVRWKDENSWERNGESSQQSTANFLLPLGEDVGDEKNVEQTRQYEERGPSYEDPLPHIKQEPIEMDLTFADTVMAVAPLESASDVAMSGNPAACREAGGLEREDKPSLRLAENEECSTLSDASQGSHHHQQSPSSLSVVLTEKLKSYSNMSLRDILTMPADAEYSPAGKREGDVMWECGFCHFASHSQAVVKDHRQRQHTRQMAEAGFGNEDSDRLGPTAHMSEGGWSAGGSRAEMQTWGDERGQASTSKGQSLLGDFIKRQVGLRPRRNRLDEEDWELDMSDDPSSESDSDLEPEDPSDESYVPPQGLNLQEVVSSEDDEEGREENAAGASQTERPPKASTGRVGDVPWWRRRGQQESGSGTQAQVPCRPVRKKEAVFVCLFCSHQCPSMQAMRSHLLQAEDRKHMLVLHCSLQPQVFIYVCPAQDCSSFTDGRAYLSHVLRCQGHLLDAQEASCRAVSSEGVDKTRMRAGFLNCPIPGCGFVSYFRDLVRVHLESHIQSVHSAQILLFNSVCSAMAKTYASVEGFNWFVCYRCNSVLHRMKTVDQHMRTQHGGRVRGVLSVCQRERKKSRGITVVVQCLTCTARLPSLKQWFSHSCCTPPPEGSVGEEAANTAEATGYIFKPCVPQFGEWVWKAQPHVSKSKEAPADSDASQAASDNATNQSKASPAQLPLIRSILLGQPNPTEVKTMESNTQQSQGQREQNRKASDDDDDIVTMVQCDDCQQVVPETEWKTHFASCGSKNSEASVPKGSRSSLGSAPHDNPATTTQSSGMNFHASLLSALATRHQVDSSPSPSTGAGSSLTRQPSSHPSLVSLLTRVPVSNSGAQPPIPQPPSSQSPPATGARAPQPDDGVIKSLLLQYLSNKPENISDPAQQSSTSQRKDSEFASLLRGAGTHARPKPLSSGSERGSLSTPSLAGPSKRSMDTPESASSGASGVRGDPREDRSTSQQPKIKRELSAASVLKGLSSDLSEERAAAPPEASTGSAQALLMRFLHQQGHQMMQVLGNVLDDQADP